MYWMDEYTMNRYWKYKIECKEGGYWIAGGSQNDLPSHWSKNDITSAASVYIAKYNHLITKVRGQFFSKQSGQEIIIVDNKNHMVEVDDIAIKSVKSVYDPLQEGSYYETEIIGFKELP